MGKRGGNFAGLPVLKAYLIGFRHRPRLARRLTVISPSVPAIDDCRSGAAIWRLACERVNFQFSPRIAGARSAIKAAAKLMKRQHG
jgi:hypothetical protein